MKKEDPRPELNEYFTNFWGSFGKRRFKGATPDEFDSEPAVEWFKKWL